MMLGDDRLHEAETEIAPEQEEEERDQAHLGVGERPDLIVVGIVRIDDGYRRQDRIAGKPW